MLGFFLFSYDVEVDNVVVFGITYFERSTTMKEEIKNLLISGAVALSVAGGVAGGLVHMHKTDLKEYEAQVIERNAEVDFQNRIKKDLSENVNVDTTNSTISVSMLHFENTRKETGIHDNDQFWVYGKVNREDSADAFKMVYDTKNHLKYLDYDKFYTHFKDAEFVSAAVIENEYVDVFDNNFGPKNLADTIMLADRNVKNNSYQPLFTEIGSYARDGIHYGYVKFDGIYNTVEHVETHNGNGFFNDYAKGSAIGNALSATGINPGLGPLGMMPVSKAHSETQMVHKTSLNENTLTTEIENGLSKQEIFNTVMKKVRSKDASVTVDSSHTAHHLASNHATTPNVHQVEDLTMGR